MATLCGSHSWIENVLTHCRNFKEIGNVEYSEHDGDSCRHDAPLRIVNDVGPSELECSPHGFQLATALRQNILDPL